jgi:predicted AAA+ superfamily ATPase
MMSERVNYAINNMQRLKHYLQSLPDKTFGYEEDIDVLVNCIPELEAKNKWLVELLKTSVAEFDDGIKYPLEVVNDLKQVLASMEPRKLTGYESEALDKALRASSTLVGRGMEKDDE